MKRRSVGCIVCIAALGCLVSAAAAAAPAAGTVAAGEGPSFFWAAVKMVFSLGIVLAILLGISHYMKKYMDRFSKGSAPVRAIAVTEMRHVAPKVQIMVVEALGSRYLLAVTPTNVSVIDKLPADGSLTGR